MENNAQNIKQQTLFDVKTWIDEVHPYTKMTERDYLAQINRCPILFRTNGLEAISADIESFEEQMPKNAFPPAFVTVKSYLAWRKKMICVLRRFHGEFDARDERKSRRDDWEKLEQCLRRNVDIATKCNKKLFISLPILIDEARKQSLNPRSLDQRNLDKLCAELPISRRAAVVSACKGLQRIRYDVPDLDGFLPDFAIPTSESIRRNIKYPLSEKIKSKVEEVISLIADGDFDEILEENFGGKRPTTKYVYRAALKKYLGTAVINGFISEDELAVSKWFEPNIFISVMRSIILEPDKSRKISDRTLRSYVSIIKNCAIAVESPSARMMEKALATNRNLRKGFEDAKGMPAKIQEFCSRLLKNRRMELLFLSLHIRFFERAKQCLEGNAIGPYGEDRAIQYGVLAAYSAIALWGVPLRITNMLGLRHLGDNPSLVLPHRSRDKAYILLDAADVKNRRPIKAAISAGPEKSLQILRWYFDNIRPKIPSAGQSEFVFPGFDSPQLSKSSLREWLYTASRELGLPMTPHNFRHGLASLYMRAHPGDYSGAARLLCNTPGTVRAHYAWIDEDAEMRKVQQEVARMAGYRHVS